jgi:hypothetical protein
MPLIPYKSQRCAVWVNGWNQGILCFDVNAKFETRQNFQIVCRGITPYHETNSFSG